MWEDADEDYKAAVHSDDRAISIFISIGVGADTTAADDLSGVDGSFLPMSNTDQVVDAVYYLTEELATFEAYGIKTSASAGMIAPPLESVAYPPEVGVWSDCISDADGSIDVTVDLTLSAEHTSALQIYTVGPNVLAATATFTAADGTAVTADCTCMDGYFNVPISMTYSSISIHVTRLDDAYRHLRIAEVEFGASIAYSNKDISGEVAVIHECDPFEKSMPVDELDMDIVNVSGELDVDNPVTKLGTLALGTSLLLSFTVTDADGKRRTVPRGRYWIGERKASDTRISISAFDARYRLSSIYSAWSIPADTSLGQTLEEFMTDNMIPHLVDESLYTVMPDTDHEFDEDSSLLDDLLTIQQAYAIYFVPDHQGSIQVTQTWPADTYGQVPVGTIFGWPSPKQSKSYNYIKVGYKVVEGTTKKTYYVTTDLRTDTTEAKSTLEIGSNGLITTEARATAVMNRLISRLYSEQVEADIRGDPAMDLGDVVEIPGKWTQEAPRSYKVTYIEETYDGTYRATVRGTR